MRSRFVGSLLLTTGLALATPTSAAPAGTSAASTTPASRKSAAPGPVVTVPVAPPSPLADAVERREQARVRKLLSRASVNVPQVDGTTALHWAAEQGDAATARLLLAAGADAKAKNRFGVTPLALACLTGDGVLVELLLAAGADPNEVLRGGETPLMTAARTGRVAPVKALLARRVDPNAKLPNGQTALMWAAAGGHTDVVRALLAAGADPRATQASGFNPLLFAVRGGHTAVVEALHKAGVDLHEAAQPEKSPHKFLRKGAGALTTAVENGHFELAAWLLDRGADPNDLRSGFSPLHILTWIRKPDRGEEVGDPVPEGSGRLTSLDLVRVLARKGANVNARLPTGLSKGGRIARKDATPFLLAADTADLAYMRLLVELGADPTLPNADGWTPLMVAAGLGTFAAGEDAGTEDEAVMAVKYLLELGAKIDAVASTGDTAMHGAAFANFPKVVKLLADRGAKIAVWNQKNKKGWTPLLIAQGYRFDNFKPSFETIDAIERVMRANGLTPPPFSAQIAAADYAQDPLKTESAQKGGKPSAASEPNGSNGAKAVKGPQAKP